MQQFWGFVWGQYPRYFRPNRPRHVAEGVAPVFVMGVKHLVVRAANRTFATDRSVGVSRFFSNNSSSCRRRSIGRVTRSFFYGVGFGRFPNLILAMTSGALRIGYRGLYACWVTFLLVLIVALAAKVAAALLFDTRSVERRRLACNLDSGDYLKNATCAIEAYRKGDCANAVHYASRVHRLLWGPPHQVAVVLRYCGFLPTRDQ